MQKVQEGVGEKLGLLLQWLATLAAGVTISLYTEWRLALLMAFAALLIAGSTAALSAVSLPVDWIFQFVSLPLCRLLPSLPLTHSLSLPRPPLLLRRHWLP